MEVSQSKKPLTLLAILSLIAVGLSVQLSIHYYDVRGGMAGFKSFCNLSAKMNCDAVAASAYSDFGGLPLSSFAAGWYFTLFIVSLLGRDRFWRREAARFAFLMTSFGLLLSVGYLSIMAFRIHTYCLFCLLLDLIALLSFLAVLWMKPEGLGVMKPELGKWKKLGGTLAACLLVSVLTLRIFDTVSISDSEIESHVNEVLQARILPVDASAPYLGSANAPITIVEFSDFQCPYCRIGAMVMNSLIERYPAQVKIVFKPFPLDASCNRAITQPMHLTACEAARTALCANQQGKFEAVYETLFDHQTEILPGAPAKLAQIAGVNSDQLSACVKEPEVSQILSKSIEEGIQLGVQSTPTFFVNGHKVEGLLPEPFWTRLVEKMLQQNAH